MYCRVDKKICLRGGCKQQAEASAREGGYGGTTLTRMDVGRRIRGRAAAGDEMRRGRDFVCGKSGRKKP